MRTETLDLTKQSGISCLEEASFSQQMEEVVLPFLQERRESGYLSPPRDEGQLYYEFYAQEGTKGTIVICHGFTESSRKYQELIYYFYRQGYQVVILDQRGHGRSAREVEDCTIVHIDLFSRYVRDLRAFVQEVVRPRSEGLALYLFAHSMGGCIGAFYLEQYPEDFKKAVLNAPMLGLKLGGVPDWAARVVCDVKVMRGEGKERLFTQSGFNPEEPFEGSSASSEARHSWYRKLRREDEALQTSSASYYWGREAINAGHFVISRAQTKKISAPVLLFQAGEDALVAPNAQRAFLNRIADGTLMKVPGVRHEIYRAPNEVLAPYLREIFEFFS